MSERSEGYVPPEAEQADALNPETVSERRPTPDSIKHAMQGKPPEGSGMPHSRPAPDGSSLTVEKTDRYHDPNTRPATEPGLGQNPSWSRAPDGAGVPVAASTASDTGVADDPGAANYPSATDDSANAGDAPAESPARSAFGEGGNAERVESGAEKNEVRHFSGGGVEGRGG